MDVDLHDAEREDQRDRDPGLHASDPARRQRQHQWHLQCGHAQQIADADQQCVELVVFGHHQQREETGTVQSWLAQTQEPQQQRQARTGQG
ncbi:hypothetical protein D3C73_975800 [compost metagenome]